MIKTILLFLLGTLPAFSYVSGNFTATSDYIFRGRTQTSHGPAIQGGLDYNHESGFNGGMWFSNSDIASGIEQNIYLGHSYSTESVMGLHFNIGAQWFNYMGRITDSEKHTNYMEYSFGVDYKVLSFSVHYTPDFLKLDTNALYLNLAATVQIPLGLHLIGTIGMTTFEDEIKAGMTDYIDTRLALALTKEDLEISINYTNTNRDLKTSAGETEIRDQAAYLSLTKTI